MSKLKYDKINIGCGNDYRDGFINIDGNEFVRTDICFNITSDSLRSNFKDYFSSYILCKDFIEHHFHWEAIELIKAIYAILKDEGVVEFELPDVENIINDEKPISEKIWYLYGGQDMIDEPARKKNPQYYCHKYGWTKESITKALQLIGFKINEVIDCGWNMKVIAKK